jgi:hypothetical protein
VSRFYDIVVYMFAKDHAPPHCHAKYGEYVGLIDIRTGEMFEGNLPRRALRLLQGCEAIYWDNGIDLCPDVLYLLGKEQMDERFAQLAPLAANG